VCVCVGGYMCASVCGPMCAVREWTGVCSPVFINEFVHVGTSASS
jgi:hypothetical protein